LLGFLQGSLVAWLRVPSFIVTLGGMLVFQGALLGATAGISVSPGRAFLFIGQEYLDKTAGWTLAGLLAGVLAGWGMRARGAARWRRLGLAAVTILFAAVMNAYSGIPLPVLLLLAVAAILSVVAGHTPFGRRLYAIGGNREAALYSGVRIGRHIAGVFTLMGALCGAAGIVLTARVGSATSDAGRLMELDSIAAAVIGGTSLLGGRGTVWGALLGALVMASLDNGMSLLNTEPFWQPILKGAILVAAVAADMATRRSSR
jgi:D-xylose transport system permease protein